MINFIDAKSKGLALVVIKNNRYGISQAKFDPDSGQPVENAFMGTDIQELNGALVYHQKMLDSINAILSDIQKLPALVPVIQSLPIQPGMGGTSVI